MAELIRVDNATHYYLDHGGRHYTLRGIDFGVAEGEFVCILGPSGCGKSTLLNILAGFLTPSEGSVAVAGERFGSSQAGLRDIKVVMQQPNLFPWLTVRRNVEFALRMRGMPKDERAARVRDLLQLVGLTGVEEKFPWQLSGGMQQRVAIARALAPDPRILLMDEPFAALDAQMRRRMQMEISRIWSLTGKTILFVTHDIQESALLADRVVVLSASPGRIKAIVPIALERPRERNRAVYDLVFELEQLVEEIRV
jgi:ABC-type nitrate/sulfonate/bicarbonate transport system ATPase subunit